MINRRSVVAGVIALLTTPMQPLYAQQTIRPGYTFLPSHIWLNGYNESYRLGFEGRVAIYDLSTSPPTLLASFIMPDTNETLVYRPHDPRANENGMVPKSIAAPLIQSTDPRFMVLSDLAPYQPVAADVNGKRATIGGRRQHREFLARNNYVEVGNERMAPKRDELPSHDRIADIKRALGE
jgi:hypothetical protein